MKRTRLSHGFSLLELMVSISVTAALLAVTVGWMHQTMKCGSQIRQRQRHHQNITRLATSLREQVRDCDSVSMVDEKQLALAWSDGTRATFTIDGQTIRFEKDNNPELASGATKIRETFHMSKQSTAEWETDELPDWISLVVARSPEHVRDDNTLNTTLPIDLHVRVAPNRWPGASTVGLAGIQSEGTE